MRIRSTGLTLFAGLSILVAACSSSTASTAPSAAAPSTAASAAAPSTAASTAPSEAPSVKPTSDLKIGVVTDVGKVNDKNFNQFSYAGAVNGAVSIGAKVPSVVVPTKPADYAPDLQAYVDQGYNIIVAVGFNLSHRPRSWPRPTRTSGSSASTTTRASTRRATSRPTSRTARATCHADPELHRDQLPGRPGRLPRRHRGGLGQQERHHRRHRRHRGLRPVRSLHPGLLPGRPVGQPGDQDEVRVGLRQRLRQGLRRPGRGTAYGDQFIKQNPGIDVVFQVAGLTGNGVIDAACAAGIGAIGVDVDQYLVLSRHRRSAS